MFQGLLTRSMTGEPQQTNNTKSSLHSAGQP
jgi:hypothetical protein